MKYLNLIVMTLFITGVSIYGQEEGYDKFFDEYGESRIFSKNNDIYVTTIDGSKTKRITHTPDITEDDAVFLKDGKHIAYSEFFGDKRGAKSPRKHYKVKSDSNDSKGIEISSEEMQNIKREKRQF